MQTPKKRAVPRDGTHPRNMVEEEVEEGSPHKRSRTSKESSGTSGSAASIASGLGKFQMEGSLTNLAKGEAKESVRDGATGLRRSLLATPARPVVQPQAQTAGPVRSKSLVQPSRKGTTTQRIDKHYRLSANERALKEERTRQQAAVWKEKYTEAFPRFRFYLDGFDEQNRTRLEGVIKVCGGTSEPFFSKASCTHVVTARKSIAPLAASAAHSAAKADSPTPSPSRACALGRAESSKLL